MSAEEIRRSMLALAFIHPLFCWWAVAAVLAEGAAREYS